MAKKDHSKDHIVGLPPKEALKLLDEVSKSFCLAKWKQVTLNLHTGTNSSCCLTPPSGLSLPDIQNDPINFHNTEENLVDRKGLKEGKKVESCSFCWEQEEKSSVLTSERVYKSASPWATEYFEEIVASDPFKKINPSYLEVSFSSKCNLKCVYCNPQTSSSIYQEVKEYGPYSDSQNIGDLVEVQKRFDFNQSEASNPYVKEFINWFPSLSQKLRVIRFTGGEPLYSEGMFKCLEILEKKPNSNLELEFNSNLSTSPAQIKRLEKALNKIKSYKNKRIITSLDTWGKQAEYIRSGLNLEQFKTNLNYLLENISDLEIRITVTFNIFSAFHFKELLSYILELKRKYKTYDKILLSIYPLISPYHLSLKTLDNSAKEYLDDSLAFIKEHMICDEEPFGFNEYELDSFIKVIDFYQDTYPKKLKATLQQDFYNYICDYDFRKKYSILNDFPELTSFWNLCKKNNEEELLSVFKESDVSYKYLANLFNFAQKDKSNSSSVQNQILEKLKSALAVASEQDIWDFISLVRFSKNKEIKNQVFSLMLEIVDFTHWEKIFDNYPEGREQVNTADFNNIKLAHYLQNDIELWGLKKYLDIEDKNIVSHLLISNKNLFINRSLNTLKKRLKNWDLFPVLDKYSESLKVEIYPEIEQSMIDFDFSDDLDLVGVLYEFVKVFSKQISKNFIDQYLEKSQKSLTNRAYNLTIISVFGHVDSHSEYLDQKVIEIIQGSPEQVYLAKALNKEHHFPNEFIESYSQQINKDNYFEIAITLLRFGEVKKVSSAKLNTQILKYIEDCFRLFNEEDCWNFIANLELGPRGKFQYMLSELFVNYVQVNHFKKLIIFNSRIKDLLTNSNLLITKVKEALSDDKPLWGVGEILGNLSEKELSHIFSKIREDLFKASENIFKNESISWDIIELLKFSDHETRTELYQKLECSFLDLKVNNPEFFGMIYEYIKVLSKEISKKVIQDFMKVSIDHQSDNKKFLSYIFILNLVSNDKIDKDLKAAITMYNSSPNEQSKIKVLAHLQKHLKRP